MKNGARIRPQRWITVGIIALIGAVSPFAVPWVDVDVKVTMLAGFVAGALLRTWWSCVVVPLAYTVGFLLLLLLAALGDVVAGKSLLSAGWGLLGLAVLSLVNYWTLMAPAATLGSAAAKSGVWVMRYMRSRNNQ